MDISKLKPKSVYWWLQIGGWFFYILTAFFLNQFRGVSLNFTFTFSLFLAFLIGVGLSHTYREIIIKLGWINLNILRLVPRVLFGTILFSLLFEFLYFGITYLLFFYGDTIEWAVVFQEFLGWEILFLLWSMFYFIFHIFRNYKNEEIKNLKWEATKNEIELNKIKSQLNPHFIFNAMNSIRALVDEEPKKAKKVITQLSNVLRNNLMIGKKKFITFQEELVLVKDYLAIEKARFEERLTYKMQIEEDCFDWFVPPIMVQTIVENGIKHGISKIPKGGELKINASIVEGRLNVKITNPGTFSKNSKPETGFGIANTKERLRLLYGTESSFSISNIDPKTVETILIFPPIKYQEP